MLVDRIHEVLITLLIDKYLKVLIILLLIVDITTAIHSMRLMNFTFSLYKGGVTMYHPLYHQARQYSGRPVYVHHLNGRTYHGTIVSVNPRGLYLIQHPAGTSLTTGNQRTAGAEHAMDSSLSEVELVYSPAAFFGFGALTGLTLGSLAGGMWW